MWWITYRSADGTERPGLLQDGRVHGLDGTLLALIESEGGLAAAAERAGAAPIEVVAQLGTLTGRIVPAPPLVPLS